MFWSVIHPHLVEGWGILPDIRIKNGQTVNADTHGSANILKKVKTQLNLDLTKVCRGALTLPKRYDLYKNLNKLYRKRCEGAFLTTFTTSALDSFVFQPKEMSKIIK